MITRKLILPILAVSFVLFPLINSCSSTQMAALPCPEPVKNSNLRNPVKKNVNHKYHVRNKPSGSKKDSRLFAKNSRTKVIGTSTSGVALPLAGSTDINEESYIEAPVMIETQNGPSVENDYRLVNTESVSVSPVSGGRKNNPAGITPDLPADCDTIILKSGKMIMGKVTEIGAYEVRYRRCDNLDGPVIVARKADLAEIRYQNGSREYFTDSDQRVNPAPYPPAFSPMTDQRKVEGLGLAGFVASLVGLFIAGIPLGIIAIIFGLVSLSKIKKQPGRFKGRGFAIASFIIGLVDVVAMIILLAAAV